MTCRKISKNLDFPSCFFSIFQGKCRFVCGQTNCNVEWPFNEVCKMALLTPGDMEYFEKKLFSNAATDYLEVKEVSVTNRSQKICQMAVQASEFKNTLTRQCPGCKSRALRRDRHNLNVECSVCTVSRGRTYRFCCQCLREWKGPAPRSDLL